MLSKKTTQWHKTLSQAELNAITWILLHKDIFCVTITAAADITSQGSDHSVKIPLSHILCSNLLICSNLQSNNPFGEGEIIRLEIVVSCCLEYRLAGKGVPYIASRINQIRHHVVVTVELTESIRHKVVYWEAFLYISTHFEASYHTWTRKERFYDIVLQLYTLMSSEYNTRCAPNITLDCSKFHERKKMFSCFINGFNDLNV